MSSGHWKKLQLKMGEECRCGAGTRVHQSKHRPPGGQAGSHVFTSRGGRTPRWRAAVVIIEGLGGEAQKEPLCQAPREELSAISLHFLNNNPIRSAVLFPF